MPQIHDPARPLSLNEVLNYEVYAAPLVGRFTWPWLQRLASRYFKWKAKRKHARYLEICRRQQALDLLRAHNLQPKNL